MRGEWRSAYDYLAGLSSWSLVPAKDALLAMLRSKLQQEVPCPVCDLVHLWEC
jgi:hypothetical protein